MVYGEPLVTGSCKKDFNDCANREIKQILDLLLCEDVLKTSLPTINELLEMPFFKNTNVDQSGSPWYIIIFLIIYIFFKCKEFRELNDQERS